MTAVSPPAASLPASCASSSSALPRNCHSSSAALSPSRDDLRVDSSHAASAAVSPHTDGRHQQRAKRLSARAAASSASCASLLSPSASCSSLCSLPEDWAAPSAPPVSPLPPQSPLLSTPPAAAAVMTSASYRAQHNGRRRLAQSAGAAASSSQQSPQQPPPSSPFSSSAVKSSYVNAADEYLRVIEGSVKTLRSLIASRQQQLQAEHSAAPPRKQSRGASKPAAAASAAVLSSSSTASSSAELSELINYQVWFAMTSLSRLLVNPEPWHLSCLCAHPAIGSYAPFAPSSPLAAVSYPPGSLSSSSAFVSSSSLSSLLMHDGPAVPTLPACADVASTSSTLTPRSSSSSSLSSEAPSPSGSPSAPPSLPVLSCSEMPSLASRTPTFDPPRLTSASSSLFASNSSASSRPCLTLAFLPDILELDAQMKREREEEERLLQQQRRDETAGGDGSWLITPTAAHKPAGSLWSPPSPAAVDSPLSPPRSGFPRGRSLYLSSLEHVKIHFRQLLLSSSHPYGFALQSFIQHMQDETGDKMRRWLAEEKARRRRDRDDQLSSAARTGSGSMAEEPLLLPVAASAASSPRASYVEQQLEDESLNRSLCQSYLQHAMALLRSFIAHHYRLMLASYPLLAATSLCRKVAYYILQSIVYDSLSRTLSNLYEDVYSAEDDWMLEKIRLRSRTAQAISGQQQQQQPVAASDGDDGGRRVRALRPHTVELLREMLQAGQIREKLALIVAVCRSVGKGGDEASSDDLIVVLCNCLLALSASPSSPPGSSASAGSDDEEAEGGGGSGSSGCVSHLYSQVRMLNDCMDESMILGEKGFCMTTLTVAMQAIATADDDTAAAADSK